VGHESSPLVSDAHVANLIVLPHGTGSYVEIHALGPEVVALVHQSANDPSQRLHTVEWKPSAATRVAQGARARQILDAAFDRGALACAAELLGVADKMIELAVGYASQRKQFGKPIGSFQAVKHMLASAKVKVEYARPLVYRAAHSVARNADQRSVHVSMAKNAASEAATFTAKQAIQAHGAIGYTWEQDLHIWMRRAWSLDLAWGTAGLHRARVAEAVLDADAPAASFGYQAPAA
jgi:alkylation response protein AidB-like acyl-CoA dehydrogenase